MKPPVTELNEKEAELMNRDMIRTSITSAALCAVGMTPSVATAAQPNVVVILSDDAGYSDLGVFGGEVESPNLDCLARGGTVFSRCYNTARCSPTRAALLTGHYPQKVGMGDLGAMKFDIGHSQYRGMLDPDFPVVAELLRPAGYRTLMVGKWDVGGDAYMNKALWERWYPDIPYTEEGRLRFFNALPLQRGFDRFFGMPKGQANFFYNPPPNNRQFYEGNQEAEITQLNWYSTDGMTDRAIDYVNEAVGDAKPFFLYLAYQAPHLPLQAPAALVTKYEKLYQSAELAEFQRRRVAALQKLDMLPKNLDWESGSPLSAFYLQSGKQFATEEKKTDWIRRMATYAAMQEIMDRNIGRLVEVLRERGVLDNTVIFYLSDNGTAGDLGRLGNTPFTGSKALLWEGGMRTPMIVWQGGHSGCGRIVSTAVSVMDITPTLLELAGVSLPGDGPAMDGRSIVSALRGEPLPEPEMLNWDLYGQKAVLQDGRWKLLVNPGWYDVTKRYPEPVYELYDLAADPAEVNNLAAQFPEKVQALLTAHERWEKENNIIPYAKAIEMGLGRDSASSVGKSKQ